MRPMETAPKEQEVLIYTADGRAVECAYWDCQWLRDPFHFMGGSVPGDPSIADCWCPIDDEGDHIELKDAIGWAPLTQKEQNK